MLHYDKIDLSEGFDVAKCNNSKKFIICGYWFSNHGFKFRNSACNGCHDLTMFTLNICDNAIFRVKGVDYR